jgi:ADP-heptose:LPS heptosyltransferase
VLPVSDLGQLGGVLSRCKLLIGNDGGPKHIAVALNVPTVTVFGPDSPIYWTPQGSSEHIAVSPPLRAQGVIADVTTEAMYEAVVSILSTQPR